MVSGTQTRAAEKLRLTQPAVSSLIDSLEEELGFKLFDRVKGRLLPTREASYFYDYVSGVLASLTNLDQIARDIRESNTGGLRIAANPSMSLGFLPKVCARFQNDHPEVDVELSTRSSTKVLELLATQQFDIGFAEMPRGQSLIEVERLRFRCVCMVRQDDPLAGRDVLRPADFDGRRFVSVHQEHSTTARLNELWAEAGVQPKIKVVTQLFWTASLFVAEGAGIALVDPLTAIEFLHRGLVAIPFEPEVYVEMGIVFPTSRPKSLPTLKFSQYVREQLQVSSNELRRQLRRDPGPMLEISGLGAS